MLGSTGEDRGEMEIGVCSVVVSIVHPLRGLRGGQSIAMPQVRWPAAVEKGHGALLRAAAVARAVALLP